MNDLNLQMREIPDYPRPGILFYDLTTLLWVRPARIRSWIASVNDTLAPRWTSSPACRRRTVSFSRPLSPTD